MPAAGHLPYNRERMKTPLFRLISVLIMTVFLCSCVKAPALVENTSSPSSDPSPAAETAAPLLQNEDPASAPNDTGISLSLEKRMASISFAPVSGQYARRNIQNDVEYTEMFALEKYSFVRAALDEIEEEVFVYNYKLDRFTYMYYFEGEMLSKAVYDMGSGTVLGDEDDLMELLIGSAQDLRDYFFGLLTEAEIGVEELK